LAAIDRHGTSATVTYEAPSGGLGSVLLTAADLATDEEVTARRRTPDGDEATTRGECPG